MEQCQHLNVKFSKKWNVPICSDCGMSMNDGRMVIIGRRNVSKSLGKLEKELEKYERRKIEEHN